MPQNKRIMKTENDKKLARFLHVPGNLVRVLLLRVLQENKTGYGLWTSRSPIIAYLLDIIAGAQQIQIRLKDNDSSS